MATANVAALCILALAASFFDLGTRRIPNVLPLTGLAAGLGLAFFGWGSLGPAGALLGALTGFLLYLPGVALGFTGGGDLKLGVAFGSLLGARLLLLAFALSVFIALIWGLILAARGWRRGELQLPFARYAAMLAPLWRGQRPEYRRPAPGEAAALQLPLAPALGLGACLAPWLAGCV